MTSMTAHDPEARHRRRSAKRKRDSAQPQKTRSASATARSLKKREAQARQRAASKNAKRKRDSAQPQKNRAPLQFGSRRSRNSRPTNLPKKQEVTHLLHRGPHGHRREPRFSGHHRAPSWKRVKT